MLKYIGNGDFIPGVPAHDLADEDLDELPVARSKLLKSGLYVEVKAEVKAHADKAMRIKPENKVIGGNDARG